jgi:hypothetical protein
VFFQSKKGIFDVKKGIMWLKMGRNRRVDVTSMPTGKNTSCSIKACYVKCRDEKVRKLHGGVGYLFYCPVFRA